MSLLFFDGFEYEGFSAVWDNTLEYTTDVRANSGDRSVITGRDQWVSYADVSSTDDMLILGVALRPADPSAPDPVEEILRIQNTAGARLFSIQPTDNSGVQDEGLAVYADNSVALQCGTFISGADWYYVEVKAVWSTGELIVRIDGVEVGSATTGWGTANTEVGSIRLGAENWRTDNNRVDDLYIVDGAGTENNDWLGDVRILPLVPTSDGNYSEWTPDTGTDHWARVDHIDTDDTEGYVEATAANLRDSYGTGGVTDPTGEGMSIMAVTVEPAVAIPDDSEGTFDVEPFIRSGTTDSDGDPWTPTSGYRRIRHIWTQDPDTAGPWSETAVNNAEIGMVSRELS